MEKLICKRCGESAAEALIYAMMASCGASLSWDPSKCYNPETEQVEEHEYISKEEYDKHLMEVE